MTTEEILYRAKIREGWTDATVIHILIDYIENQDSLDAFQAYLDERSSEVAT